MDSSIVPKKAPLTIETENEEPKVEISYKYPENRPQSAKNRTTIVTEFATLGKKTPATNLLGLKTEEDIESQPIKPAKHIKIQNFDNSKTSSK